MDDKQSEPVIIVGGEPGPTAPTAAVGTPATAPAAPDLVPVVTPLAAEPALPTEIAEPDSLLSWTASEFIAHQKTAGWYGILAGVAVVVAVIIYLITHDLVSAGVVIFGALIFGFYGSRQPRQLLYQITNAGISIGQKFYEFSSFRSFSVIPDGAFASIVFMPLKRFSPPLTIYFAPDSEDAIIALLADHLPFQEQTHDAVDRLMRRIRF